MNNIHPKVLIFDSGVGGLSIFNEIKTQLPHAQLLFASDNLAFPYGTKSDQALVDRVQQVMRQLVDAYTPDLIVIACNSASTIALPTLREQFQIPIVGVVPAIKPAAQQSQTKCIGLLATPATIQRDYTQRLITQFASECQVIKVGSSELVTLAEYKLRGGSITPAQLTPILAPFLERQLPLDTLVLGCTHFPLLRSELGQVLPAHITLIDSGDAIARQVSRLLNDTRTQTTDNQQAPQHHAIFTRKEAALTALHGTLGTCGIQTIHHLTDT